MKNNKSFLMSALVLLTVSSLLACSRGNNDNQNNWEYDPEATYEIGDTVKEWKSDKDFEKIPLDVPEGGTGIREISKSLGNDDKVSLHYKVKSNQGYITSEINDKFFSDLDAKGGDIISLYVYVPSNSNLSSLELEVNSVSYSSGGWGSSSSSDTFKSNKLEVNADKQEKWIRLEATYNTLYVLNSIRLNFVPIDNTQEVEFYVDDINITFGAETEETETKYVFNNESLYKTYKDYFIVGTELSANMAKNSKFRQITRENFCSVTAENEAKPNSTLDQAGSQALVKNDPTAVAVNISSFKGIYDWCEAAHIKVRHHTFVWHDQTPDWFFREGYQGSGSFVSRDVMIGRLNNFFKAMIDALDENWPGLVYALDVVNEALPEEGQIRDSNWMKTIGEDYIYQAFVAASTYKKDYMDLYYNDYSFEQSRWGGPKRLQTAVSTDRLLKKAIDEKILDGIGIQSHCLDYEDVDAILECAGISYNAGVKCQLTELDINCNGSSEFDNKQKEAYSKLIKGLVKGEDEGKMDVNAVILWGITDNLSWHSDKLPLLFNADYSKKPAYYSFLNALSEVE